MARNYKWLEVGNTRVRVDTSARAEFLPAVTWRFSARSTWMKISSRVVEAGIIIIIIIITNLLRHIHKVALHP